MYCQQPGCNATTPTGCHRADCTGGFGWKYDPMAEHTRLWNDEIGGDGFVTILDADCNCPREAHPVSGTDYTKVAKDCPMHGATVTTKGERK